MTNQQTYLENLQKISQQPLYVAKNQRLRDAYIPQKRKEYNSEILPIDHYEVLSNQVVLDFDKKSWIVNYTNAKKIINVLEDRGIKHYIYASSNKGIHIEIFFEQPEWQYKEVKDLFKKALSYGLSFKHIRGWLVSLICSEADINMKFVGQGNNMIIDTAPINFDDLTNKHHFIRACGGRNQKIKQDDEIELYYKTFIESKNFKKTAPRITNYESVQYPTIIETFKIDEHELGSFLQDFIKKQEILKTKQLENIKLEKGYLELPCISSMIEGLGQGVRSYGARIISVACKLDGLNKEEATEVLHKYVENCSQIGDRFSDGEAVGWMDWIYSQTKTYWNCALCKEIGVCDDKDCPYVINTKSEAYELLKSNDLLARIIRLLNIRIVGEDKLKVLLFLLMLSKDFPQHYYGAVPRQHIILSADSSSGKTYIIKQILKIIGEEDVDYEVISRLSRSVLNYYCEENQDGKVFFIEEMQGLDENTAQLRVWMSEGRLKLNTVEKIRDDDGNEVNMKVTKVTNGEPVFMTCQAEGEIGEQLRTRCWILSPDLNENQTKKIQTLQSKVATGDFKDFDEKETRVIYDAIRELKPYRVLIPYYNLEAFNIPSNDIRGRRDGEKLRALICASAHLHQKQRSIVKDSQDNEYIVADFTDYEIAKEYCGWIIGASFTGLSQSQINMLDLIRNSSWKNDFAVADIQRLSGKSKQSCRQNLKQLDDLGFILSTSDRGLETHYGVDENRVAKMIILPDKQVIMEFLNKFNVSWNWIVDYELVHELVPKTGSPLYFFGVKQQKNDKSSPKKDDFQKKDDFEKKSITVMENEKTNSDGTEIETLINSEIEKSHHPYSQTLPTDQAGSFPTSSIVFPTLISEKKDGNQVEGGPDNTQSITVMEKPKRTTILRFMTKSQAHKDMNSFEEILEKFGPDHEMLLECLLDQLKSEGAIFSPRPGYYKLLN